MFTNCVNLPGFNASATDKSRCYAGTKNGVKGYFYSASLTLNQNNNNPALNNKNNSGNTNSGDLTNGTQEPVGNDPAVKDENK